MDAFTQTLNITAISMTTVFAVMTILYSLGSWLGVNSGLIAVAMAANTPII